MCGATIGFALLFLYHWLADPATPFQNAVTTGIIATVVIMVVGVIYTFVKNNKSAKSQ